jgi:hypothetical protein
MELRQQMAYKSGKVYGPAHPAWIAQTTEILDDLQSTLRALSGNGLSSKRLKKIEFLQGRLKDLCELAKLDIYWRKALPMFLKKLAQQLMKVEEVWAPGLIRSMIATAECLSDA